MFKLATRKLQRLNFSYYIALPISWVRDLKLLKNSDVEIFMTEDKQLIIKPVEVQNAKIN